jgi:hypothetical protein
VVAVRTTRPAGRHQFLRSGAAVGITGLALLLGSLVGGIRAAEAATIPDNPCVQPEPAPVTTTPVVTRVSTSTRVVDVRRRAKTLAVTVQAHDTVAITSVVVTVSRLRGTGPAAVFTAAATLVTGSPTVGVWRAAVRLPRYIPDGTYRVSSVRLRDAGRGVSTYYRHKLPTAWPARFAVRSIADRTAPAVTGFDVSARSVDTRSAPATITLRVRTRDDLSGVAKVRVRGVGVDPAAAPTQPPSRGFSTMLVRSAPGEHRWIGRVVVPMWAGVSTWNLSLKVTDRRSHTRTFYAQDLARRGWQPTLRVTSGRDLVQPSLAALSFAPSVVDARTGDVRVEVSFRVTDDLSGASARTQLEVGPSALVTVSSITGPANDRTFHGYLVVPQCGFATQSTWTVNAMIVDNALNERWLPKDQLDVLGLTSELSLQQRDGLPPIISSWTPLSAGSPLTLHFSHPVLMSEPPASLLRVRVDGIPAAGTWTCRDSSDDLVVCDADDAAVVTASFSPTTAFVAGERVTVCRITSWPERIGIYDMNGVPLATVAVRAVVG